MATTAGARASAQNRLRWELLAGLVRKDLKVKYKDSSLGFAWSMANPLLLLAVYYFVFAVVLPNSIPGFVVYLMSGLLIWQFFSGSVSSAVGSVLGSANLVKKVRFPLGVLPLSSVGFAAVHFVLQMGVFVALLLVFRWPLLGPQLLLVVPALALALIFTVGLSVLVAAVNVRYRDVEHILEVALLAWFWVNPIVYPAGLLHAQIASHEWLWRLYFANPMATVVATMQRAIYGNQSAGTGESTVRGVKVASGGVLPSEGYAFYFQQLAICGALSLLLLWVAVRVFRRMQGDFAEEL